MQASVYKDLIKYAEICTKGFNTLDAGDLVNDFLLECLEKGEEIDFAKAKVKIRNAALSQGNFERVRNWRPNEHERHCKKCNEVKPAACFTLTQRKKHGNSYKNEMCSYCKECQASIMREYRKTDKYKETIANYRATSDKYKKQNERRLSIYHLVKNTVKYKTHKRVYFKKWAGENKDKWNAYNRERMARERELLTDAYCRKCLRNKYSTEFLKRSENYWIIEEFRASKRLRISA